jgi:polyhydroxybutyrate depolymerase
MRLIAFVLALLLPSLALAETVSLGDRFYRIDLPAKPKGAPLILVLHGGGGDPDQIARVSGLSRAARREGYAVIFPAGTGNRLRTWNAGYCCGPAARKGVDDLAFLTQVIADAQSRFGLGTRVYMTGMSNGAMLAETYAAQNPDRLRAVAAVSGTMDTGAIRVLGPVPMLILHGTADQNVPYDGGRGDNSLTRTNYASVASAVAAFLGPWGSGLSTSTQTINRKADGTTVVVTDTSKGAQLALRLMTIEGGGHNWPGGAKPRSDMAMTEEIDANTEILRFFALHP